MGIMKGNDVRAHTYFLIYIFDPVIRNSHLNVKKPICQTVCPGLNPKVTITVTLSLILVLTLVISQSHSKVNLTPPTRRSGLNLFVTFY